ncbi:MAG TPA: PIG-L deacetylase family protein [Acidimicrobiales bacterium]|nr:PIG-L deacetylase family protein [Acidimicrobiales bacterium]
MTATDAPGTALAVYAHPDDPEVSCGGTIALWSAAGCQVHVAICAAGDKGSSDPAARPEELARRRAEEAAAAGDVLGVAGHHLLGHPDGEVENTPALRAQLVGLVRRLRPQVVVCPDPTAVFFGSSYFNHRDHRQVGWACLDAVAPAAANPHYFPDAGSAHQVEAVYLSGTLMPDLWVDITATIEAKARALLCHASQLGETGEWLRQAVHQRAEEAGRQAGVRYAEGFRVLHLMG